MVSAASRVATATSLAALTTSSTRAPSTTQAATENKILDRTTKTPNWEGRGTYLLLCMKQGDGGSFLAACGASVLKTPVTVEWL